MCSGGCGRPDVVCSQAYACWGCGLPQPGQGGGCRPPLAYRCWPESWLTSYSWWPGTGWLRPARERRRLLVPGGLSRPLPAGSRQPDQVVRSGPMARPLPTGTQWRPSVWLLGAARSWPRGGSPRSTWLLWWCGGCCGHGARTGGFGPLPMVSPLRVPRVKRRPSVDI
jgi:hypothetical protein